MTVRKIRANIPKVNMVRAELQKEINSICPFCDNDDVGHFEIHHIDEDPSNNSQFNLLLLCPICHSKITKGAISELEVYKKKMAIFNKNIEKKSQVSTVTNFNSKIENAVVGDNNNVTIQQTKKVIKSKYPDGCIGSETIKANYISHLIGRFNEYKEFDLGKGNVKYGVFGAILKKEFKVGPTRTIYHLPIGRFEELVDYIQQRINKTKLAKIKPKTHKHYSTFEEYIEQVG
jgi:hypothetical protein